MELVFFDPPNIFDDAIIGVIHGFGQEPAVVYDEARIIVALVNSGLTQEDAREHFDYNTVGAYVGPATPRFIIRVANEEHP